MGKKFFPKNCPTGTLQRYQVWIKIKIKNLVNKTLFKIEISKLEVYLTRPVFDVVMHSNKVTGP